MFWHTHFGKKGKNMKKLNSPYNRDGNIPWITRIFGQSFVSIDRGAHITPDYLRDGNEIAVVLGCSGDTLRCCWYANLQFVRGARVNRQEFIVPISKVECLNCQQRKHLQSNGPCLTDANRRREVTSVLSIIEELETEGVNEGKINCEIV